MDLSHQSITGHQFDLNRRGYDPDAVDAHLAEVAAAVAGSERRIAELESTISSLEAKVRDADESEEALRLTLKAAAHAKEELLAGAREQAKTMEEEAAAKAGELVAEAAATAETMVADATEKANKVSEAAAAKVAAMEDAARERVRAVAAAALAESELVVAQIEELRTRFAAAEEAVVALRSDVDPKIQDARVALEAALEQARESVDHPEILEGIAANASPVAAPAAKESISPARVEGVGAPPAQHEIPAASEDAAVPNVPFGDPLPPVPGAEDVAKLEEGAEPSQEEPASAAVNEAPTPQEHYALGDAEAAEQHPQPAETQPEHEEPHLEVVDPTESASEISDKVDRLLEELREVT